jgi:uncharacterized membrane protein
MGSFFSAPEAGGFFIPVLNPLELGQAAFLLSLVLWIDVFAMRGRPLEDWPKPLRWGIAALLFLWINLTAARGTWRYMMEGPYDLWLVVHTAQYQGVIAILWGVIGLCAVLGGQRARSRVVWRAGAVLLAADIVKLLLVDLNKAENLTRIMAFLVLGGLFVLIGWAAPLPPKDSKE